MHWMHNRFVAKRSRSASLNKRFAPIVHRPVQADTVPDALRRLNWIEFDDPDRFDERIIALTDALTTDIDWVRKHTELGEAGLRWTSAGRPRGLLLGSIRLHDAERWIASRPRNAPLPTDDTQAFIQESRRAATRRRNVLTGSLAAGLMVALVLAALAYWQRGIAIAQERLAEEQRQLAEERRITAERQRATTVAELATVERLRGNLDGALRLGEHAARLELALDPNEAATSAGRAALAGAVAQANWRGVLHGHQAAVTSAAFSPDGKRVVTASGDRTARIWDANTANEIAVWKEIPGKFNARRSVRTERGLSHQPI
jgi:hypothetical protein